MGRSGEACGPGVGSVRGRRVVVTGGASGIGSAVARRLIADAARVVVVDVDAAAGRALEEQAQGVGADLSFVRADVSREQDVVAAVGRSVEILGGIDALIHAAGIMQGQLLDIREFDEVTWDRVVDINLKGAFLVAKHVARVMIPAGRGVMILVASKGGVSVGSGSYAYGASKGGVLGLALTLERHLDPLGIRVHTVCPGDVDTPLMRRSLAEGAAHGGDPAAIEAMLGRLTDPATIADLLAFLVSDAAASVRGTVFTA